MKDLLNQGRFDFISKRDKGFILAFNDEMTRLGYGFGDQIGSGYCWGKYMIIYTRAGAKSKKVFARIYIRDESIALRFFLNDIEKHREYVENAPSHIKDVFVGDFGDCKHCHNEKDGRCRFRKTYTLDSRLIEKCNGSTFEFRNPSIRQVPDYMALFAEFYPKKKR